MGTHAKETEVEGVATKDCYTYTCISHRFTASNINGLCNVECFRYRGRVLPFPPPRTVLMHGGSVLEHSHDLKEGYHGCRQLPLLHAINGAPIPQVFVNDGPESVPEIGLWVMGGGEDVLPHRDNLLDVALELVTLEEIILLRQR